MLFEDGEGRVRSLPTAWTSVAAPDPYVTLSGGRSHFRIEDLLTLVKLVTDLTTPEGTCKEVSAVSVKKLSPSYHGMRDCDREQHQ